MLAVLFIFKDGGNELPLQLLGFDRGEILVGSEVNDKVGARGLQVFIQQFGDGTAPKLVEVTAARIVKLGAHFESVGLHAVERT